MNRPSWHEYFMSIAEHVSTRTTCLRRQIGAVAVRNNQILATGYNGAAAGKTHCIDVGCLRDKMNIPSGDQHEKCLAVHAEQNVICQAAKYGISLDRAYLYCTHQPCSICAKMIINTGITKVIYKEGYPDPLTQTILMNELVRIEDVSEMIPNV